MSGPDLSVPPGGFDALGPEARRLDADQRGEIADYLLGQQDDAGGEATRKLLGDSAGARAWARAVAGELRPVAKDDLPEIPDATAGPAEEKPPKSARRARRGKGAKAAAPAAAAAAAEGAKDPAPAKSAKPAKGAEPAEDAEPAPEPVRDGDDDGAKATGTQRSSRLGGALLLAGLAILVAVVVVLLVTGGDDGDEAATTSTPSTTQAQTGTQAQPQPVAQINLRATDAGNSAVGVAQILRQGNQDALAIVAQKLKPNSRDNAYAVWLYSSKSKARLLGFVDPPVGKDRQFSNFQALPRDARNYREVVVSRETQEAKSPTTIILRGPLRLRDS